jgi:hypothetical protein
MNRPLLAASLLCSLASFAQEVVAAPPPADVPVSEAPELGRLRYGADTNIGVFLPQTAVMIGAEGRLGYQFNRTYALYANLGLQVGLGIGGSVSSTGASASINIVSFWHLGVLGEMSLADHLTLAAGPVLASGAWAGIAASGNSTTGSSATEVVAGGMMPGLDFKVGFSPAPRDPVTGRRQGFTIGLDAMLLFAPNSVYVHTEAGTNGSAGAEVRTSGLAVGFVPTLTLGYEGR